MIQGMHTAEISAWFISKISLKRRKHETKYQASITI
jgi:hypothetical protein